MIAKKKKPILHHLKHHAKRAHLHVLDHFIPHERNHYKPHALKHHVLFGYSVILILLKALVIVAPIALPSSSLYSSAITPQNIVDLTNQARQNLNLAALSTNDLLMNAAQSKATDMLNNQYFAHTSPAGVTPWDWFKKVGYQYLYAGENLAVHFIESEDVQSGWMASPTHRANIVSTNYTQIGVGVASGIFEGVPSIFVVQEFAKPQSTVSIASEPVQPTPAPTTTRVATVQTTPVVKSTPPPSPAVAKPSTPAIVPAPLPASVSVKPTEAAAPAAVPQSDPAPTATPEPTKILADTSQPVVQKIVASPVIDESSFSAVPTDNGYRVRVMVPQATSVEVRVSQTQVSLTQLGKSNLWEGLIPVPANEISKSGESMTVLAANESGRTASASLALIPPRTDTQQLYIFNEGSDRFTTLFGFLHITNLNDGVRRFYIEFIVALSAILLLYLFVSRIRTSHLTLVGHAVGVLVLAIALAVV